MTEGTITPLDRKSERRCGDCQLCCKLLPMSAEANDDVKRTIDLMLESGMVDRFPYVTPDFDKPAGQRCPHQRHGKGCSIYRRRPFGCRVWTCAWLAGEDLPRPDRCHYVVDNVLDEVEWRDDATGEATAINVIQVWCDPGYPEAWRDPPLLGLIERMAGQGVGALVRYGSGSGFSIWAPALTGGRWVKKEGAFSPDVGIRAKTKLALRSLGKNP